MLAQKPSIDTISAKKFSGSKHSLRKELEDASTVQKTKASVQKNKVAYANSPFHFLRMIGATIPAIAVKPSTKKRSRNLY